MEQVSQKSKEKIEVVYVKAKIWKRFVSFVLDLSLIAFTTFAFYALMNMGFQQSLFYKSREETMNALKVESGLYVADGRDVITYVESDDVPGIPAKKDYLSNTIENFYNNDTFFSDRVVYNQYHDRQLKYTVNDHTIFYKKDNVIYELEGENPQSFLTFYESEIKNYSNAYLFKNVAYTNALRENFIIGAVMVFCAIFASFLIYVLLIPLTLLKRGRQTISMKIMKIGYVSVHALNIRTGKYVGRTFFSFVYYIPLNFVAFLIPTFVTMGMMYFGKMNQTFNEYVFNDYMVDVSNQDIYLDYLEYLDHNQKNEKDELSSLELNVNK